MLSYTFRTSRVIPVINISDRTIHEGYLLDSRSQRKRLLFKEFINTWLLEYVYNDILCLDKVGYWMLIIRISYSRTRPSASEYVCNPHTPMPHHQRMVDFMIHETYLYGQVSNIAGPITMGEDGRQTNPSRALWGTRERYNVCTFNHVRGQRVICSWPFTVIGSTDQTPADRKAENICRGIERRCIPIFDRK